jgi:hypothetical protein
MADQEAIQFSTRRHGARRDRREHGRREEISVIAGKLDAVLPLTGADFERFRVLHYSIQRFFECLNVLWIVTPESEYKALSEKIREPNYQVIPEESLIPELKYYRRIMRPIVSARLRKNQRLGWFVQQLVKMSIASTVETDFYMTFDADVVCVKPVKFDALVHDGRGVTNTTTEDWHAEWYGWSEKVLGMKRSGITHGVTPALFNKTAMLKLQEYLERRTSVPIRAISRLAPTQSSFESACLSWRAYLLRNIPWTEYGLYNTYLENTNQFDQFHFAGGVHAIYDTYNSVWFADRVGQWDPSKVHADSFFMVLQSRLGIRPEYVLKRLQQL